MGILHYLMEIFDKIEPYIYKLDLLLERRRRGNCGGAHPDKYKQRSI